MSDDSTDVKQPRDRITGRFLSFADGRATKTPTDPARRVHGRSSVTNGALFLSADGRSSSARRFRDLVENFSAPWGGFEQAGEDVRQIIRTAARLQLLTEILDSELANGEPVNPNQHVRLTNALHRTLIALDEKAAVQAKQKPNGPTLPDPYRADKSQSLADLMGHK